MIHPVPKPIKAEKKKPTKKKKTPEAKIIEEIDLIDSDICLITNGFVCILCGGKASFTHHFFHKKSHGVLRFEPDNHCPVCYSCHRYQIHSKGDTEQLRDNLIRRIGREGFDRLKELDKDLANRSIVYLRSELFYKQGVLVKVAEVASEDVLCMMTGAAQKRLGKAIKDYDQQRGYAR